MKLKKKQYFQIGQTVFHIIPNPFKKNDNNEVSLLKVVIHNETNQIGKINPTEYLFQKDKSPVTIGRKQTCSIPIESTLLSKIHCSVIFNTTTNCWEIMDGSEGKPSTNGTWIWVNSKYELNEEVTLVKIRSSVIKIKLC
jgi:hypothetical protein